MNETKINIGIRKEPTNEIEYDILNNILSSISCKVKPPTIRIQINQIKAIAKNIPEIFNNLLSIFISKGIFIYKSIG